jgi:hypothetical protein
MNSIKDKLREKLYIDSNNRFSEEYYKKVSYGCYFRVSDKLNIDLKEKCNEIYFKVREQLLWNDENLKITYPISTY